MANYLGRNVNLALLLIIIGVVVALVGTTVFFQRGLQNRTQAYETTTSTLSECQVALANYQGKYVAEQAKANQSAQDIRKYDQLYEQKTNELRDSQTQLTDTQKNLNFQTLQREKFQQYFQQEQQYSAQLNETVTYQSQQITSLNSQLRSCNSALSTCKACANSANANC